MSDRDDVPWTDHDFFGVTGALCAFFYAVMGLLALSHAFDRPDPMDGRAYALVVVGSLFMVLATVSGIAVLVESRKR